MQMNSQVLCDNDQTSVNTMCNLELDRVQPTWEVGKFVGKSKLNLMNFFTGTAVQHQNDVK